MRSLKASPKGIEQATKLLSVQGLSRMALAANLGVARSTVTRFFNDKPIAYESFVGICNALGVDWQEVAELTETPEPKLSINEQNETCDIDELVKEVRQQIQPYIQVRCGTMRVLDMSRPIGLGEIYTSVNILEKLTRTRGLGLTELMRDDSEDFDRFCLGNVRERLVLGLEAVEQFSKLMILGKPGAGKTTFLKHLAIQCIGGKFQAERVPVFITLKDFAETNGKPDLLEYLDRLILTHPVETQNFASLKNVVRAGRALILLDGLDEVRDADSDRVLRQITGFSQQFPQNQFVITCRIAAWEYTFDKFTEVEIADFNDKQIADFSGKWFSSKNDPIKAERFLEKLKEDAPIRELATNPLLLTLLCLVFEDFGSFPTNRAELYQTGVDVLLKKWDVKRNIERDPVYKRLSLKRKEDLLSHIAHTTFEAGNYFFKQRQVEYYISQYIQNLPNASTDPEVLELDTAAVLKSIEAQHGLLVERARGIYSFSHLTFHEYFTARKIVTNCNPHTADDPMLQKLVSHLTEKCWREVFLLVIGILYSADTLLRLMKTRIDEMLADNRELQQLISWLDDNTSLSKLPTLTRASLFTLAIEGLPLDLPLDLAESSNSIFHFSSHGYFSLEELSNSPSSVKPYLIILSACETGLESDRRELHQSLQQLKKQLPESGEASETLDKWWQKNGQAWTKQLRAAMIEYRNIGHDWQFSDTQKELLRQYYDANKLLVDCLNSDCYVSREVRQEIEDTLLLPISEIEKRQQSRIR